MQQKKNYREIVVEIKINKLLKFIMLNLLYLRNKVQKNIALS